MADCDRRKAFCTYQGLQRYQVMGRRFERWIDSVERAMVEISIHFNERIRCENVAVHSRVLRGLQVAS